MQDSDWGGAGRWYAWAYGTLALVGGVIAAVASSGIPPTEPDLAAHYAYVRKIWPELYVAFLLLLAAFLNLLPIGLVLRQRLGQGLRGELLFASFLGAGMVGILWMLLQIGSAQAVVRDTSSANWQDVAAIGAASSIWSAVINWMERGFLLFAGAASYWTGRAALEQHVLSRGLGWFSLVVAALYLAGFAVLVLRDLGLLLPDAAGSLFIAVGSLSATVWAGWLGWELGRKRATPA
jgi:hypothetical protein